MGSEVCQVKYIILRYLKNIYKKNLMNCFKLHVINLTLFLYITITDFKSYRLRN